MGVVLHHTDDFAQYGTQRYTPESRRPRSGELKEVVDYLPEPLGLLHNQVHQLSILTLFGKRVPEHLHRTAYRGKGSPDFMRNSRRELAQCRQSVCKLDLLFHGFHFGQILEHA